MKAISLGVLLAGCLAVGGSAQVMMEHAAAVAGATVGTVGGKVLSNAIDKTLGKAAEVGNTSAAKVDKTTATVTTKEKTVPASKIAGSGAPEAGPGGSGSRTVRAARRSGNRPVFADEERSMPAPVIPVAMTPPPPSADDFSKMKEGISRDQVYAALGTPSSRVTIPDEGHLVEILTYSDGAQRLGTIHVDNGQVVSVKAVSPK